MFTRHLPQLHVWLPFCTLLVSYLCCGRCKQAVALKSHNSVLYVAETFTLYSDIAIARCLPLLLVHALTLKRSCSTRTLFRCRVCSYSWYWTGVHSEPCYTRPWVMHAWSGEGSVNHYSCTSLYSCVSHCLCHGHLDIATYLVTTDRVDVALGRDNCFPHSMCT